MQTITQRVDEFIISVSHQAIAKALDLGLDAEGLLTSNDLIELEHDLRATLHQHTKHLTVGE
jgi:hypothetical protein